MVRETEEQIVGRLVELMSRPRPMEDLVTIGEYARGKAYPEEVDKEKESLKEKNNG